MPYSDEGVYAYETEVPAAGDTLRKSAMQLAHDIESYLFDYAHPGYDNKAYLAWAVAHFGGTHNSSGMIANTQFRWDPAVAAQPQSDLNNEGKNHASWGGKSAVVGGIHYSSAANAHPDIDTSPDVPGEAGLYEKYEVTDPNKASEVNGPAVVVGVREPEPVEPAPVEDGDE